MLYLWHRRLGVALFDTFWEQRPPLTAGGGLDVTMYPLRN